MLNFGFLQKYVNQFIGYLFLAPYVASLSSDPFQGDTKSINNSLNEVKLRGKKHSFQEWEPLIQNKWT